MTNSRPGALLILSKWYTRRELALRNAILFCGNLISNAFSSLVGAAVLGNMEGTLGHEVSTIIRLCIVFFFAANTDI